VIQVQNPHLSDKLVFLGGMAFFNDSKMRLP
jgi:hypothetical protein